MATAEDWQDELRRWLGPFLSHLGHKARRRMCPLYVAGLIGPGERKSVQPMASRTSAADYDQLHHFVGAGILGPFWVRGIPTAHVRPRSESACRKPLLLPYAASASMQ